MDNRTYQNCGVEIDEYGRSTTQLEFPCGNCGEKFFAAAGLESPECTRCGWLTPDVGWDPDANFLPDGTPASSAREYSRLIECHKELTAMRDGIQERLDAIYQDTKDTVLQEVIDLGLYRAPWQHQGSLDAPEGAWTWDEFYLDDAETKERVQSHMSLRGLDSLDLAPGVILFSRDRMFIHFSRDSSMSPADFVKVTGLKVRFEMIDGAIRRLTDRKRKLQGTDHVG